MREFPAMRRPVAAIIRKEHAIVIVSPAIYNGMKIFMLAGSCGIPVCEGDKEELIKGGSTTNGQSVSGEEGVLLAGTSVFVLKPGEKRGRCIALSTNHNLHCYTDCYPLFPTHSCL